MQMTPTKTIRVRRSESKMARVDVLLIGAIFLVFVVTAATHHLTSRKNTSAALISADFPDGTSYSPSGEALLKARIGFARGIRT